jgi:tetratricopeptide (TPR) repeat protein
MKRFFLAAAMIMIPAISFATVNDSAGIIFPSVNMDVGTRAEAMAGAFTAIADDVSAVYWNPAGLALMENNEIDMAYDKWFMDTYYSHLMAAIGLPTGNLGVDIFYMNFGTFNRVSDSDVVTGTLASPYSMEGSLAYGISLAPGFSAGITAKFMQQSMDVSSNIGVAADIGAIYKTGIISMGISAQNIGTSGGPYSLPMSAMLGFAVKAMDTSLNNLLIDADCHYIFKDVPVVCIGAEYTYSKFLSLRLGYSYRLGPNDVNGFTGPTAGAGINLNDIGFDYAFVPYGDLGITNSVTLKYMFGARQPSPQPVAKAKEQPTPAAVIKKTVKKTEEELNAMFFKGAALENDGKLSAAETQYTEILKNDPKYAEVWKRLGAVYVKMKRKADAISCFETYLKLKPDDNAVKHWVDKNKQ